MNAKKTVVISLVCALLAGAGIILAATTTSTDIANTLGISGISMTIVDGAINWGVLSSGVSGKDAADTDTMIVKDNQTVKNLSIGMGSVELTMKVGSFIDGDKVIEPNPTAGGPNSGKFYMAVRYDGGTAVQLMPGYKTVYASLAEGAEKEFKFNMQIGADITFSSPSMTNTITVLATTL